MNREGRPKPKKDETKNLLELKRWNGLTLRDDNFKATEANRKRGPGTREKVRSRRINLEGNTYAQEINVSQCPV
jgi:hypothetical protein